MDAELEQYLELVRYACRFNEFYASIATEDPDSRNRPRFNQQWFPGLDGALAYAMVRRASPRRIVEVGSGHSTRFMAQAIADGGTNTILHSIDPQPRREIDALCTEVTRTPVQEAPSSVFDALERGDMLFIDGSHKSAPGSDVDLLLGHVLPRLSPGVFVHIHDIFLPEPYPPAWAWRAYNEQLVVAALLAGGSRFKILCPNAYLRRYHADRLVNLQAPLEPGAYEASLWLEVNEEIREPD